MRGDDAIDYPEHLARDHRTAGEEKTQQVWKAEHPLAHRLMGKYLIYQKGCALGHATHPTDRAESTSFATKSDQAFLVAFLAPYPQESVFKPPALQVVFEFPLHIARQYPAFLGQLARRFGFDMCFASSKSNELVSYSRSDFSLQIRGSCNQSALCHVIGNCKP